MARDVIVVGSGGGGAVVAKELASRGLDVLLLEAGSFYKHPESDFTHLENDANNPLTGFFRFGPGDRSKPAWFRETPQNSFLWQLAGVGGTTLHYYGNCPRAMPGVFAGYNGTDAAMYDSAHAFPFTYSDLVPYYEWVEATLPVQTAAMGTKEEILLNGAQAYGLPLNATKNVSVNSFRPQENAILQPGGNAGLVTETQGHVSQLAYPYATGCTFCGYCFQGCKEPFNAPFNKKAKRTTLVSYVPMALTANVWAQHGKAVTLVPNAFATNISTCTVNGALTVNAVTWKDTNTGDCFTEDASVVVLAGGCTETPRLWLNSALPNPNGWVGRGYTDHYFDWVVGVFDEYTGSAKGVGSSARVDFPGHGGLEQVGLPPALQAFSFQFSNSGIRGSYGNGGGMTGPWDGPAGRLTGLEMKEVLSNVDQLINLLVLTDDDAQPQNRVTLSALTSDENGPVAKVEFPRGTRTARTVANREYLAAKATGILRAAGAKKVYRLDWPDLILHVQSTMRMGNSDVNSVLDANAQSRFVQRLYVADNSALSNALGGPNPTLTSQALATRTAEAIFRSVFGGDPWVGHESPVVSTADSVTAAVTPLLS